MRPSEVSKDANSYHRYQDYNFSTPDARFVYIRLISDAQIKVVIKPNKYKVEEHLGPKISKMCQIRLK